MGLKIKLSVLNNLIWVILLVLVILNAAFTPKFITYNNIVNIFYHTSVLGFLVLAQGLCLISGNFDLSIESIMAFAPAIAILIMTRWFPGFNPILAILVVFIIGAIIGLINGFFVVKVGISPFLQTLSTLIIFRGLVYFLIPMSIFKLSPKFLFLGSARTVFNIPVAVIVTLVFFYIIHIVLTKSIFGRSVLSIGGNIRASYISGINTDRALITVFMISGLLASMAGLISVGRQASITNAMGEGLVFMAFAGSVMGGVSMRGGIGTALGMLGGLLVLGVIDNSLTLLGVNVYIVYATKGILIFIAVFLDNFKIRLRESMLYREELKKFKVSD